MKGLADERQPFFIKKCLRKMTMKAFLEKLSILSLSFMLVSTFAVSPALPAMVAFFEGQGIGGAQVELLITVTSFAIMVSLLVNPLISRFLSEKAMISLGLLLLTVGGVVPLVTTAYPLVFLGRLVLGFGLGLINAKAITIISSHYEGQERLQLLGWRGSSEVLGSASLTALVGLFLNWGLDWAAAFSIYFLGLLILGLYLAFVPKGQSASQEVTSELRERLIGQQWRQAIYLGVIAAFVIHVNTLLTLKIPQMVDQAKLGTPQEASLILSAMMLMGIVSGLLFSSLFKRLGKLLLPVAVLVFTTAIALAGIGQSLLTLALGAILSGFFYSIVLTVVFNKTSENTPAHLLNQKMTIVLMACNLGGASASILPALMEQLIPSTSGILLTYAVLGVAVGLALLANAKRSR